MRKIQFLLFGFILIIFSGCVTKTTPAINTFTIKSYNYLQKPQQNNYFSDKTIKVAYPKSTKDIMSNKIWYMKENYSKNYYMYSRWTDTPNKLLMNSFLSSLQESSLFKSAFRESSRAKADFLLESNLLEFHQNFNNKSNSEGILKIQFYLIDMKSKEVVKNSTITITTKAKTNDAKGGVEALNKAAKKAVSKMIEWLCKI